MRPFLKMTIRVLTAACCLSSSIVSSRGAQNGWSPLEKDDVYRAYVNITLPLDASIVNTLFQDDQGMMWFGTRRGLFSYNGFDIHNYPNDYTTDGNFIVSIIQISPEYLCIGTNFGLLTFNRMTGKYETVYPELSGLKAIRSLALFNGELWIGTLEQGLFRFDMDSRELKKVPLEGADETAVFAVEPAGEMLFTGSYEGLGRYDLSMKKRTLIPFPDEGRITVGSLLWDGQGQCLWVGTETYLYRYFPDSGVLERVDAPGLNSFKTLAMDAGGNLVAGTDDGLWIYAPSTGNVSHIVHDSGNPQSLGNNVIWKIVFDRRQNVWIATDRGVSMTRADDSFRFMHLSEITGTSDGNLFTCLFIDSGGDFWLGGENGLIRISNGGGRMEWFRSGDRSHSLAHNHIRRIYEDREGDLWIASDGSIARYDRTSGRFVFYTIMDKERNKDAKWAYDIYEDVHGRLWVATYLGGLFVMDKRELIRCREGEPFTKFIHVMDGDNGFSPSIYRLFPDGRGHLWANAQDGLGCIDIETFEVTMRDVPMDGMTLSDNDIYYASEGRLFRYGIVGDTVEQLPFSVDGGQIYAFVRENGRIWFSATNGIFFFDPTTGKVHCVSLSQNYIQAGLYRDDTDEIMWGGEDCIYFCPAGVETIERQYLPVYITGISRDGELLSPGSDYKGSLVPPEAGCRTAGRSGVRGRGHALRLKRRGDFTLELSSFAYSTLGDENYFYRINESDPWHSVESGGNHINFVTPKGGSYSLSLSGSNPEEDADALVTAYLLSIPYPWYAGPAAYCVYVFIFLCALALTVTQIQRKERRKYEQRKREETLALSSMKMDFFVNIAHELKTPLSLIIAPLSKMISETVQGRQRESLQNIHKNALRLNSLIYKVLDFKQIEYESENTLIRSCVELRSLVEGCVNSFRSAAEEKGVRLTFLPEEESVWMNLDALKMESVFINLISNALKYAPDGTGEVSVTMGKTGDRVEVTVADNGPGIQENEISLVFIRFFQGKNSAKVKSGTGIGLYLVKKFVELHGGEITLRNASGLNVSVLLPTDGENAVDAPAPADESGTADEVSPDKTLLIIDDNVEMVSFLVEALSAQYSCRKAYDGQEGLEEVRRRVPDLILVDQMMPRMDGFEFTKAIRHNYPTAAIPIIMLTAKDDAETELRSIRAGIDAFIAKPFDLKKLILRITQLLSRQQTMEEMVRLEAIATPKFEDSGDKSTPDELLMKKICAAVEENMQDETFNVTMLAGMIGVEPKQLYRKVKQMTGLSPVNFVRKLRMKKAAVLLAEDRFTVSEVMYMVGYSSASYFTKCFFEEFGLTPKQYQNTEIEQNQDS